MNIFVLSKDPLEAARYHCDKHVVKMILETAQLLCTAHWETGGEAAYKSTHKNHPCAKWARRTLENYDWLCDLGLGLCAEYTYRYGKRHKSQDIIEWCLRNKPKIKRDKLTDFVQAMPDCCKHEDPIQAYRMYYNKEKRSIFSWKNRSQPDWIE